ncbi:hypothetical protein A2310_00175 [candidate division WOR-1 bacterium RIFOXYB2_FULL_37_13]|uniref:DNA polymerase III subunit delta n=1 Tax=candidate division WOR-1 bacterium RIFOXYB2_FULL_37_13 TaxID=1802579 RepID=A0A1F4SMT8_UNCSA|nr:MAG: hypothetical protein A2310_00175 [candidate division WOR-1 bacterium RIFOXYB2_FULL_37_13]
MEKILSGIIENQRISNAYLFCGGNHSQKVEAAVNFASKLNCKGNPSPCHECLHCEKIKKGKHPDVIFIQKENSSIKINQIRFLKEITKYGPSEGAWQVVIIDEADTITNEAANSFLKILEEPSCNVVFILISEREGSLPKTILSRCQKFIFEELPPLPPSEMACKIHKKIEEKPFNYIDISQMLSDKKTAKEILQEIYNIFAIAKNAQKAKVVLETLKGIEKNANHKLVIDFLCFNLWNKN